LSLPASSSHREILPIEKESRSAYQSTRVGAVDAEEGDRRLRLGGARRSGRGVGTGCGDAGGDGDARRTGAEGGGEGPAGVHGCEGAEMEVLMGEVAGCDAAVGS
jgi:hypothetical protein